MKRVKPVPCSFPVSFVSRLSFSLARRAELLSKEGAAGRVHRQWPEPVRIVDHHESPSPPSCSLLACLLRSDALAPRNAARRRRCRLPPFVLFAPLAPLAGRLPSKRCRTSCVSYCAVSGFEFSRRRSTRCVGAFHLDNRESRSVPSPRSARLSREHRWVFRRRQALALNESLSRRAREPTSRP